MKRPIDKIITKIINLIEESHFIYRAFAYANVGAIEGYGEIILIHVWYDVDSFIHGKPALRIKLYENGQMEITHIEGYADLSKNERETIDKLINEIKNIQV
jgi:hypothetical protein